MAEWRFSCHYVIASSLPLERRCPNNDRWKTAGLYQNDDYLKNVDDLKNEDDIKIEDDLRNNNDIKRQSQKCRRHQN